MSSNDAAVLVAILVASAVVMCVAVFEAVRYLVQAAGALS
jgi:hypothetical protein